MYSSTNQQHHPEMVRKRLVATLPPQQRRRLRKSRSHSNFHHYPLRIPLSNAGFKFLFYLCILLFLVILITSHQSLPSPSSGAVRRSSSSSANRLPLRFRETLRQNQSFFGRFLATGKSFLGAWKTTEPSPRIAILLPFIGKGAESVPPYLGLFCGAAGGSAALVDFLIFHANVLTQYAERTGSHVCPPNVKFINLESMDNLASNYLLRLMDQVPEDEWEVNSREMMTRVLTHHLMAYPYALVEYKPTFGHVFADYIQDYTHWGYSDLDIVFGDLTRWITPEELSDFDIVTYGFGDQNRVYLRGQFTFHKNNHKINQLWRKCEYLSRLDRRFGKVLAGEQKLKFESAEGCYSAAVLDRTDLRVKYATKAFTDTLESDPVYSHGLYIARQKHSTRQRSFWPSTLVGRSDTDQKTKLVVLYKAKSIEEGTALLESSPQWFDIDTVYSDISKPLQSEVGRKELIELKDPKEKANCTLHVRRCKLPLSRQIPFLCLSFPVSISHRHFRHVLGSAALSK
jgi:hypothetical protein